MKLGKTVRWTVWTMDDRVKPLVKVLVPTSVRLNFHGDMMTIRDPIMDQARTQEKGEKK